LGRVAIRVFRIERTAQGYCAASLKTAGLATPVTVAVMVISPGGWRKCIELGRRSGVADDAGIDAGVSASCSVVVKGNTDAGNRVAVLLGDEHGEGLGQLRSGRRNLNIAAGDSDVGCASPDQLEPTFFKICVFSNFRICSSPFAFLAPSS
jgi:hypothetical protein